MTAAEDNTVDTRIVSVVNSSMTSGQIANALLHMGAGLCNLLNEAERKALKFLDFEDASGTVYASISARSFIVLKGRSVDMARLREATAALSLPHVCFLKTMTGGTYLTQLQETRGLATGKVEFIGVAIYGKQGELAPITRRFSLF